MIQVDDKIISTEIFEQKFHCDLTACKGNCCVFGDSGAPLSIDEVNILDVNIERIKPFISRAGRKALKDQGNWVTDRDGDMVTPLVEGKECAYTYFKNGIAFCGIEKAFFEGKLDFRKPLSCHLYPIRLSTVGKLTALNYHKWPICNPARSCGQKKDVPVFRFVKDALIRAFGEGFYEDLEKVFGELENQQGRVCRDGEAD